LHNGKADRMRFHVQNWLWVYWRACFTDREQCEGCQRIMEVAIGRYCTKLSESMIKWKTDHCNSATHAKAETAAKARGRSTIEGIQRATKKK